MPEKLSVTEFLQSIELRKKPASLNPYQESLWEDAAGNWETAHELIQDLPDKNAALLHAYLHRVEGDQWNARYWYNRAGEPMPDGTLKEEWSALVKRFI